MQRGLLLFAIAGLTLAQGVRFLRWQKLQPIIASLKASGEKLPEFTNASEWDTWIYARDLQIRSQAEQGVEDSISALILFGNSFTNLPRLANTGEAVDAAGGLSIAARERIDGFIQALDERDDDRFRTVLDFLQRRRVTEEELRPFLGGIIRRLALDQAPEERIHENTTSALLLVDFAFEEALRALKAKGETPARIRRIAVIGAGLDFAGSPDHFDFHPPQSLTPYAVQETVARLNLAQGSEPQVTVFELGSFALSHIRTTTAKARAGVGYNLQLPRRKQEGWNAAAVSYWNHFGEAIATSGVALPVPSAWHDIETRSVTVKPQFAARVYAEEMDVVTQNAEPLPGQGFDLIIALHHSSDHDHIEQALALASVSQMLNSGGVFLADADMAKVVPQELNFLGAQHVAFQDHGEGHNIAMYRKK